MDGEPCKLMNKQEKETRTHSRTGGGLSQSPVASAPRWLPPGQLAAAREGWIHWRRRAAGTGLRRRGVCFQQISGEKKRAGEHSAPVLRWSGRARRPVSRSSLGGCCADGGRGELPCRRRHQRLPLNTSAAEGGKQGDAEEGQPRGTDGTPGTLPLPGHPTCSGCCGWR